MASEIKVDTISEKTSANGVTIDGVSLKDSKIATANSVDSDAYVDGSIDAVHLSANSVDSDAYVDGSIDTAHIGATQVTGAKLNTDAISAQTELAVAPADTDEFMVSDAGVLKRIDYSLIKGGDNTPAAMVILASDQSISTASWTKVALATESWDTDGTFASNKFTPAVAGKYLFTYGYSGDVVDDAERIDMQLYKNGSAYELGYLQNSGTGTNTPMGNMGAVAVELDADDYIELFIYQNSGDTLTLYANRTSFTAMKIAGA
mgnify:CR=1 FL=1